MTGAGVKSRKPKAPARAVQSATPARRVGIAYLLWLGLGFVGGHRFYLRDPRLGLIYALTGGLFMVGWFADAFLLPKLVHESNRRRLAIPPARVVRR